MGQVFLGTFIRDAKSGRRMSAAIKRVPASKMDINEVKLQASLSKLPECNLHVACLYDLFKEGNNYYIVMEYIQGKELFDYLADLDEQLGLKKLKRFFRQALEGLAYIHSKGMAHGDIKIENLMLDERTDRLKYIDFGYGCNKVSCKTSPALHGTSYLYPPEAFNVKSIWSDDLERYVPPPDGARTLDGIQRADVWALGSLFVEMMLTTPESITRTFHVGMSGKQLKDVDSRKWLASNHLADREMKRNQAYDRLYAIIDGMMKLDPDDRITAKQALIVLTANRFDESKALNLDSEYSSLVI